MFECLIDQSGVLMFISYTKWNLPVRPPAWRDFRMTCVPTRSVHQPVRERLRIAGLPSTGRDATTLTSTGPCDWKEALTMLIVPERNGRDSAPLAAFLTSRIGGVLVLGSLLSAPLWTGFLAWSAAALLR